MQFSSLLLLVSSIAIPMAVARTIPDDVQRRSAPDMALVVRAIGEVLPGAGNDEVHEIIARLEEEGHFDSLDKRVSIGLDPSLWVTVSGSCTTCIAACVAGVYTDYRAGNNIPTLSMWGQLAVCGTTCVLSGECGSSRMAATYQAQQPHTFPTDAKKKA